MSLMVFFVLFFLSLVYAVYSVIPKGSKRVETPTKYDTEVKVDLTNCVIKSNQYYEDITKEREIPSKIDMIDALYGKSNMETVSTTVSVISIQLPDKVGKLKKYNSPPINMEEDLIRVRLEGQRFTTLYLDSTDSSKYYLDIGFLFK